MAQTSHVAYALKQGQLVHVSTVVRGLTCGCYCPVCNNPVIAKKGSIREHHFAHARGTECAGAAETVLHLLAKEIIAELSSISIPAYNYKREKKLPNAQSIIHEEKLANGGKVTIEDVAVEKYRGSFTPDIEILSQGKMLIVEIAVTHKVGKKKLRLLRKHNVPAIEIHLPPEYALKNKAELRSLIENDIDIKHWLYHPREIQAITAFYAKYRTVKRRYSKSKSYGYGGSDLSASLSVRPIKKITDRMQSEIRPGPYWYEVNRRCEEFFERHGRYPSRIEGQKLFLNPNKKWAKLRSNRN